MPFAVVAAGCGDTVSLDPVAKAADVSSRQTSEHMNLSATITSGLQNVTVAGSGDFQNHPNLGSFTISVTGGPQAVTMHEVLQGTAMYVTSDAFTGELPNGKTWLKVDLAKAMKSLGIDVGAISSQTPRDALARLKAGGTVTKVGPETIDGVSTTHYSVVLDPGRIAKLTKTVPATVSYAPVDAWVDAHGLVRRVHLAAVYGASATPQAALDMTMSLSDYGEHVDVTPPPDDDVYDATNLATHAFKN